MGKAKTQRGDYYLPQYVIEGKPPPIQQMNQFTEDVERGRRQVQEIRPGMEGFDVGPVQPGQNLPQNFDAEGPRRSIKAGSKPALQTLENGMTGFFDTTHTLVKPNDRSGTQRQLFNVVDPATGQITERMFLDPKGGFTNMTAPENLPTFIQDPDTFNPTNPSGFDPKTFEILQQFKNNPEGLAAYTQQHPEFKVFKQGTMR